MQRRALLLATAAAMPAWPQRNALVVAVPFYRQDDVVTGLHRFVTAPRAAAFLQAATALERSLQEGCAAAALPTAAVRAAFNVAVEAWERLSTVAVGPLVERRSLRRIDFTPVRPEMVRRAIDAAPRGEAAMERIGAPAKGLPALEWLLWKAPPRAGTPACSYAVEVAADIRREAQALAAAFDALAKREWEGDEADAAFGELINQWLGALERLRWQQLERPARQGGRSAELRARHESGGSAASWARQWQVLRELALFGGEGDAPQPGQAPVPFETFLRGRGLNPLADKLVASMAKSGAALRGVKPADRTRVLAAATALAATRQLAEAEVAPALDVPVSFSDADGD